jgi:hypothetical protein
VVKVIICIFLIGIAPYGERESGVRFYSNYPVRGDSLLGYSFWLSLMVGISGRTSRNSIFLMALRMLPVVHLSGGMSFLMVIVAGHSLRRCQGVWSSMKHLLEMGSSLLMMASCLARKQCPVIQRVMRPKSDLLSFRISFDSLVLG